MTDTSWLIGSGALMPPRQRTSEGGAGLDPVPGMKVPPGTPARLRGGNAPTAAASVTT